MARSSKPPPLDTNVFTRVGSDQRYVLCKKHQQNLWRTVEKTGQQVPLPGILECFQLSLPETLDEPAGIQLKVTSPTTLPILPPFDIAAGDPEVPLSQLWDEFQAQCTVLVDDYFDEIQWKIKSGKSLFSTILLPLQDELGLEDIDKLGLIPPSFEATYENYGIDADAIASRAPQHVKSKVAADISSNEPLYPWKSMPEFLTHLLFSSPRLRFSQAQKVAVLTWAKELGAPEVPSMYAVKKTQERFMRLLGTPTEKVTTASGNVFYLNALSKVIAMSTGSYFIPKKIFQARISPEGESAEPTIFALGHKVSKTAEGFAVDPEMIIIPVSTFFNMFEDLQHWAGESGIKFTGPSLCFKNSYAKSASGEIR
ncbi:hypothetical protein EDC04DRAFT_2907009 [Pisolithus marmoratus]|nr:hypothetical protein EDC04DRAFT_2907009 [Pisolithus marmoratus]